MKSFKTPTTETVEKAIGRLFHPQAMAYFLDRLTNPRWIKPLHEKGLFESAPLPYRDEAEGTIRNTNWPAMSYLRRMLPLTTDDEKALIANVLEKLKTDDPFVRSDIAQIALVLG